MNENIDNTPEEVLAKFLVCWKERQWDKMVEFTQLSWANIHDDPAEALKGVFSYKPLNVSVVGAEKISDVAYKAVLDITYALARGVSSNMKVEARMICETAPMEPSPDGVWGVNPQSLWNRIDVKTTD